MLRDEVHNFCHNCNTDTKHQVSKKIWHQPNLCVLIVNRFKQLRTGRIHKDTSTVFCNDKIITPNFKAELSAAVFHKGSTKESGHYIAAIKSADKWYECDDLNIRSINFTNMCSSKEVYIMFYHKLS